MNRRRALRYEETAFDLLGPAPHLPVTRAYLPPPHVTGHLRWKSWKSGREITISTEAILQGKTEAPLSDYVAVCLCYVTSRHNQVSGYHVVLLTHARNGALDLLLWAGRSGLDAAERCHAAAELLELPLLEGGEENSLPQRGDRYLIPRSWRLPFLGRHRLTDAAVQDELVLYETRLHRNETDRPGDARTELVLLGLYLITATAFLMNVLWLAATAAGVAIAGVTVRLLRERLAARQTLRMDAGVLELEHRYCGRVPFEWSCRPGEVESVGAWPAGPFGWGVFLRTARDRVVFGTRLHPADARRIAGTLQDRLPQAEVAAHGEMSLG